ncbi:MAG: hypothetical protein IJ880_01515 [Bacilli bacterium]|nr:hypothetical protein [Bacilli bacterium]
MKDIEKFIELSRKCAPTILASAALCVLPITVSVKRQLALDMANKEVIKQMDTYREKVIEFAHDDLDRDIRDRRKNAMKVRKNADIYDAYIDWMPQVNETQIYEAYNEYKELGI